ncbi:hypothetical protein WL74_29405 [Burkholderia cepacia]|nr:hypothetical protein WL74_29405 [Burkholderia cepacia]
MLEVLEATYRLGSLTAASDELHLSQPALSHALNRLRTAFADPLFVRTSRGMQPTPRAGEVAESARRILAMVRAELGPAVPFCADTLERTFRLGMSDVAEMVILPRLVQQLRSEAPRVNVVSMTMPARKLSEGLESGAIDLAIGPFPDLIGAELKQRILFERGFLCLLSSEHPRIHGDSLTIDEFLAEPHLVVFSLGRVNEAFERFLGEKKLSRRIMLSVPHMLCVPSVIADTDLIATVPYSAAVNFRNMPGIKLVEPPISPPKIRVGLYWSERFSRDPGNAWLRAMLASLFNQR